MNQNVDNAIGGYEDEHLVNVKPLDTQKTADAVERIMELDAKRTIVNPGFLCGNGNIKYWHEASPKTITTIRDLLDVIKVMGEALLYANQNLAEFVGVDEPTESALRLAAPLMKLKGEV